MGLAEDRKWLQNEETFWGRLGRKEQDRRSFGWVLGALLFLVLFRLMGCPRTGMT